VTSSEIARSQREPNAPGHGKHHHHPAARPERTTTVPQEFRQLLACLQVLDELLGLGGRTASFTRETHLLGAVPEFDSMAVVAVIAAIEERLGVTVEDDEIDGATFATIGSLVDFVAGKLAATSGS